MATQLSRYCRWLINLCSNIAFTLPIFSFYKVAPDIYRLGPRYQDIPILSRMLLPPRSMEQYPLTCISPLPTAQLFLSSIDSALSTETQVYGVLAAG